MKRLVAILGLFSCLLAGTIMIAANSEEAGASAPPSRIIDQAGATAVAHAGNQVGSGNSTSNSANKPAAVGEGPADCGYIWHTVTSPNANSDTNYLQGMATLSASNIWAVGYFYNGSVENTLVERWNGTTWAVVPSPNSGTGSNQLLAVAAISDDDIWAVGYANVANNVKHTLAEHWNGSSWSIVTTPAPGTYDNVLESVAAVSSGNVSAVGYQTDAGHFKRTLIEYWNGVGWLAVTSPNNGTNSNVLQGVAAVAGNDIWAVGYYVSSGVYKTLVVHWNGSTWAITSSPNAGSTHDILDNVSAGAGDDVWAVGYYESGGIRRTLAEHWNGATWVYISSPSPGTDYNELHGVSVFGSNDAWAVGGYQDATTDHTLAEHWDGSSWTTVPSTDVGSSINGLNGVAILDSGNVWAVGEYLVSNNYRTLVERYSLTCYTPTPASSSTPGGPTNTPTSTPALIQTATATATSTPASVPTSCPLEFMDVPDGSTFYSYVRCMACRGIVNGYATGCENGNPCFRPNNKITRGQLAKIVANSAGLSDPGPTQLFEDVAQGSTFYTYVQSLANANMIGGYSCGGAGEPCVPPGNLPYFRPNNNATRGQITKIVSNAAGFNDTPSGHQFEDVATGSTYYTYTYRLVSRSIMNGYPCGGANEPCVPPGNLPYFRPNNNATRGQTSKIVANTFFPNCQTP